MLLPDITIGNNILSIQDPYTINGCIVTNIDIKYVPDCYAMIKGEYGFTYSIGIDTLKEYFTREIERFICINGYNIPIDGRRDINLENYTFANYISDIKEQCMKIQEYSCLQYSNLYTNSYDRYINSLKTELRRQGRNHNINADIRDNYISYNWDNYISYNNYGYSVNDATSTLINAFTNFAINETQEKYIHSYKYKPEYIPHYMPKEDANTTLLLGAEIEVDCGGKSEEHAKEVLKIICGIDPDDKDKVLEDKMYCTSDGSLKAGIEFDTMPCSLEYHKNEMKYREMFEYLDKNGYKAHDTTTCGLHIHVDRKYLGKSELVQQLTISKILYILEKFNDEICVIARRNNNYSKFVGDGKNEKSVVELYAKYKDENKHVALNLKHKESIEFRCFKGTLKYETFILTLEFVKDIVDYAKSINIEEVELIKWEGLMNTFSEELKEYYNIRLEKEKKKQEVKSEKLSVNSGIRMSYTLDELSCLNNCIHNIINETQEASNKTLEDKLKDKIKSLKKKISNSNNYMEKKNLQKELKEAQKELKKEKKKNKLNNNTER